MHWIFVSGNAGRVEFDADHYAARIVLRALCQSDAMVNRVDFNTRDGSKVFGGSASEALKYIREEL